MPKINEIDTVTITLGISRCMVTLITLCIINRKDTGTITLGIIMGIDTRTIALGIVIDAGDTNHLKYRHEDGDNNYL